MKRLKRVTPTVTRATRSPRALTSVKPNRSNVLSAPFNPLAARVEIVFRSASELTLVQLRPLSLSSNH
jgi:hypothetical protein